MKKITMAIGVIAALFFIHSTSYAFTTEGFQNPYGVAVDPTTNFIYVSNVNGAPDAADGNGFISKLKGDGSLDQLKFIESKDNVVLNAPKGMTVLGTTLYVTDIAKLHVFDLTTGKLIFDINFGDLPVQHFYDITIGPESVLYLTDGPANVIYRVDVPKQHEVTTFVSGDTLGEPHAICWYDARQMFLIAGAASGQVIAFDKTGRRQGTPQIFLRTLAGLTTDDVGNIYVSSTALSAVFRITPNFALNSFALGLNSPTGVAFQKSSNQIIITSFDSGKVMSQDVPKS